ncbi:GAF domain-containing protein [Arthrobacter echini]|nr:GAF domain-containing protein [Arthrobacter echini]
MKSARTPSSEVGRGDDAVAGDNPGTALPPGGGRGARSEAEKLRLLSVARSRILEVQDAERFDRIVRYAREIFEVSSASIGVITADQQILFSVTGPLSRSVDRGDALCNVTIQDEHLLVVEDTHEDPRFSANALVTGDPRIRFYAGCPLRGPGGWLIGTLCVIDQRPRAFTAEDQRVLRSLAAQAELELNTPPVVE